MQTDIKYANSKAKLAKVFGTESFAKQELETKILEYKINQCGFQIKQAEYKT